MDNSRECVGENLNTSLKRWNRLLGSPSRIREILGGSPEPIYVKILLRGDYVINKIINPFDKLIGMSF